MRLGSVESGKICLLLLCVGFFSVSASATEENPLSGLNLKDFRDVEEQNVDWLHNPFVQQKNDINIANLVLSAVIYSEQDSSALINGEIIRVNDQIGSSKVVAIHKQSVLLRNESGVFELQLKGQQKNEKT